MARDPDSLPYSLNLSGPCPRCGRVASFTAGATVQLKVDDTQRVNILTCMGCQDSIVVVEHREDTSAQSLYEPIYWWPSPGAGDLDPAIPAEVASAYAEGIIVLSVKASRAAAIMFRGMLAQIVRDSGSESAKSKGTLYAQLAQMSTEGTLYPSLADWASEIRIVGNAAAHPDNLEPVSYEEASELARLCKQMLTVLYEVPARIARSRSGGSTLG